MSGDDENQEDVDAANKKRKKKSSKPGAHTRWLKQRRKPDDYTSDNPKWT